MSIAMQLSESEVEDFSTATTAEMLGLGSAAIKTRLHRARLFCAGNCPLISIRKQKKRWAPATPRRVESYT